MTMGLWIASLFGFSVLLFAWEQNTIKRFAAAAK
jgi:hypothetical protein